MKYPAESHDSLYVDCTILPDVFLAELVVFPFMVLVWTLVSVSEHQWWAQDLNWRPFSKFLIIIEVKALFFISKFKELFFLI